jgi:hypothetical protein
MKHVIDAAKAVVANWEKGDLADAVRTLDAALQDVAFATSKEIQRARDEYQTDEIEIDGDAYASHCDGDAGMWVSAWVWLAAEDAT